MTLEEILAAIKLIAALLPIIESAISIFGNTDASKSLALSAIPSTTPAPILAHVSNYVHTRFGMPKAA